MVRGTRRRHLTALFSALVCFGLAAEASGQTAPSMPNASSTAEDFDALVKKGDQARIAGKWPDALEAYGKALKIRDDPLVAGRLGLVVLEFREYDVAAIQLLRAVERGAGVNDFERSRFVQAFLVAQKQTCRLEVVIVQTGVNVEIDGKSRLEGRHDSWTFVKAGKHTIHASLEGFEDQTIEIDAPKGGLLPIKIDLRPVKPTEDPAKEPEPEPASNAADPPQHEDKPAVVVVEDKRAVVEDKQSAPTNPRWENGSFVFGLGLGFVFEATPTPAIGPHAFVAWRSRSWWEVGVDARVAWTVVEDKRAPTTQFVTWSAMLVPCGRWKRLLGCGLLQLDGISDTTKPKLALLPSFGLRGGYELVLSDRLGIQILGEIVVRPGVFEVLRETSRWESSFVGGAASLRGVYRF